MHGVKYRLIAWMDNTRNRFLQLIDGALAPSTGHIWGIRCSPVHSPPESAQFLGFLGFLPSCASPPEVMEFKTKDFANEKEHRGRCTYYALWACNLNLWREYEMSSGRQLSTAYSIILKK